MSAVILASHSCALCLALLFSSTLHASERRCSLVAKFPPETLSKPAVIFRLCWILFVYLTHPRLRTRFHKATADGTQRSSRASCSHSSVILHLSTHPDWRDPPPPPPRSNIVTSCVSLRRSSLETLQWLEWLQCRREPGSACQSSTQGPLRFLLSLSLDAVMQDPRPQPAFFPSPLLLILAAQCRAVFAVMQERASCKCNLVEFCVRRFRSELLLQSALVSLGTFKLKNRGICNFMLTRLDSRAAVFFFFLNSAWIFVSHSHPVLNAGLSLKACNFP